MLWVTRVGRTVGLVGVLGLVACSSPSTAAHVPQAPAAEPPLVLPPGVGEPSSTVLIGDLHGTREIPAFVGRLVATLAGPPAGRARARDPARGRDTAGAAADADLASLRDDPRWPFAKQR